MTGWDYAQLSHLAKELGGPRALISNIRSGGIATGRWQGGIVGSAATLAVGGVALYLYNRHQKKLALANESAEILEADIKAYDIVQTEKVTEGDEVHARDVSGEGSEVEATEE